MPWFVSSQTNLSKEPIRDYRLFLFELLLFSLHLRTKRLCEAKCFKMVLACLYWLVFLIFGHAPSCARVGLSVPIFFEEKSKKDFHCYPSCKTHSSKKCQLYVCPSYLNPMAGMPIEDICYFFFNSYRQEEQRGRTKPKKTEIAFQKIDLFY